jgi:hypothetical protein
MAKAKAAGVLSEIVQAGKGNDALLTQEHGHVKIWPTGVAGRIQALAATISKGCCRL